MTDRTKLGLETITPEDTLRIVIAAALVPDNATVYLGTKHGKGVFKRKLKIWPDASQYAQGAMPKPTEIEGFFIVYDNGSITQVKDDTLLQWEIVAEQLADYFSESWAETPQ